MCNDFSHLPLLRKVSKAAGSVTPSKSSQNASSAACFCLFMSIICSAKEGEQIVDGVVAVDGQLGGDESEQGGMVGLLVEGVEFLENGRFLRLRCVKGNYWNRKVS